MPNSFRPFKTSIGFTASGIGFPPLIRTPSISKAYAYASVTVVSGGVSGELRPLSLEPSSAMRCLAISMAAAISWALLGFSMCSGGPWVLWLMVPAASLRTLPLQRRRGGLQALTRAREGDFESSSSRSTLAVAGKGREISSRWSGLGIASGESLKSEIWFGAVVGCKKWRVLSYHASENLVQSIDRWSYFNTLESAKPYSWTLNRLERLLN